MRWIGQHIWDFISRFRSDVYLEATETGTIASGGNLGLDSNNKIVKSASPSGTIDLTSEVTGVLPVASGGSGTNTLLDNAILTGTGTGPITAESTLFYVDGILTVSSSDSNEPGIYIVNSNEDSTSSLLEFQKSADGADGDDIGRIIFDADNAVGQVTSFAQILGEIGTAADTDEAGKLSLQVAASNDSTSALQQALTATGHGTSNTVNIGLGYGATSLTTIAGDLDIDGDTITAPGILNINPSGSVLQVDAALIQQANSAAAVLGISNTGDNATGGGLTLNNSGGGVDMSDGDSLGIIQFSGLDDGTPSSQTYAQIEATIADVTSGQEAGKLELSVAEYDGTVTTGLKLDGDTDADGEVDVTIGAGAASVTTIAGTLTMGSTAFVNNSGVIQVATQGTIDHDSLANFVANEHLDWTTNTGTPIHRGNITTLDQINGGVHFSSNSAENPVVKIENNHTTAGQSGELRFIKDAANIDDGEYLGRITFYGDNDAGTPEEINYCEIIGQAKDVSDGAEEGYMYLNVASHDGEMKSGVRIFSGDAEDEVDVTIGNGTTSLTTTAGHFTVTSNAYIASRDYSYPGTSDGDHTAGDIMYYDSGTASTTAGKIYYFNGSGSWTIANADAVADATGMLAVALGDDPDVDGMLLRGFVTLYDINGTEDHGAKLYLHTADGEASATAPGSGNVVRVIGYNLHNTNDSVYFNPDSSWVEVS